MKNKITFVNDSVLVNGAEVARLDGSREVYITMKNAEGDFKVVARFKYRSPKASAKHWLKFILQHFTSAEIVAKLAYVPGQRQESPLGLAETLGYVSLNMKAMLEKKAQHEFFTKNPAILINYV